MSVIQERIARVEYRSQQADNALKQLEACIEIINSKGGEYECNAEARIMHLLQSVYTEQLDFPVKN